MAVVSRCEQAQAALPTTGRRLKHLLAKPCESRRLIFGPTQRGCTEIGMLAYRYLGWTLLLYGLGYLVVPIEPNINVATGSFWLWLCSATLSMAGLYAAPWLRRQWAAPPAHSEFLLRRASRRLNLLATAGLVFTLLDRYALRGVPLNFDFFAARDVLEAIPPTPIGLLGAMLGALSCFALGLTAARAISGERPAPTDWLHSALIFSVYIGISMGVGSRSTLLVSIISTMFSVIWMLKANGRRLHLHYWAAAVGVVLLVAGISAVLMLERLDLMGLDPMVSIEYSGYAFTTRPTSGALLWLTEHSDSAPLLVAAFSLLQYVYHGFFEFALFAQEPFAEHTWGSVTMWLPVKVLNILQLNISTPDLENTIGWRDGVFTTFLGPLFLDFGELLPAASFLLFLALGLPAANLQRDRLQALPYCSMLCALCVLFPVANLLDSAAGAYPLVASMIVPWLGRWRGFESGLAKISTPQP